MEKKIAGLMVMMMLSLIETVVGWLVGWLVGECNKMQSTSTSQISWTDTRKILRNNWRTMTLVLPHKKRLYFDLGKDSSDPDRHISILTIDILLMTYAS